MTLILKLNGQKKKEMYVREPLTKLWLLASVSGTNTTPTKEIKYKIDLSGGTPYKIMVVIFSCAALIIFPKEA